MEDYGRVILRMRKAMGMTQNDFGKELNVTFQAVSKWENGLSLPDLNTISKMCKIFDITVDEFTRMASMSDEELCEAIKNKERRALNREAEQTEKQTEETVPEIAVAASVAQIAQERPAASTDKAEAPDVQTPAAPDTPVAEPAAAPKPHAQVHIGFLIGLICALVAGVGLFVALNCLNGWTPNILMLFIFLGSYFVFSFIALIGHDTVVWDFFLGCIFKSVHVPGVIFTLDIDGIFFLIVYRFIIAPLITVFVWLGCVIGGFILSFFMAGFVFPFKIPRHFKETFLGAKD